MWFYLVMIVEFDVGFDDCKGIDDDVFIEFGVWIDDGVGVDGCCY